MQAALTTYFDGERNALGLLCHAAFLLAFDLVAERRGAIYLSELRTRSAPLVTPASARMG